MKNYCMVVLLLAIVNGQQETVTSTSTAMVTETETSYVGTDALCASVTTAESAVVTDCRRRRNYWIDVPVYIALDEDVDDQLTQFFHPSSTYAVEPTLAPTNKITVQDYNGWLPYNWLAPSRPIQPSIMTLVGNSDSTKPRAPAPVGFALIANLINEALIAAGLANPTTFVMVTNTITTTNTETTTTSTKTIFLSGCRPNPFPFTLCQ